MPCLPDSGQDDQLLVEYLLGLLPETKAELLDELSIVDDDVASRLCVVESDLVDAYVSGTLDRSRRDRFESFYLSTRRRREKVEIARGLVRAIDRRPC